MKIPDEIIEELSQQADIVEIIGDYVDLKRRGANFVGLCPFHNEKTPSFNVSPDKGIYKCFGCGKAGNTLGFLMDYNGMSFPEAIKHLATRIGFPLPESASTQSSMSQSKRTDALKAIDIAAAYYHSRLGKTDGKPALNYFLNRGFSKELIIKFKLGYAPDSWDSTLNILLKKAFTIENLLDAGLIIERESGGHYDRFRNRAMFPIRDFMGRIIGFGARRMNEDETQPKYINSPQSLIYDKSKSLYGLFESKTQMRNRKEAIIVEGYADVLSLHQAGFENTVASSGTALTIEQLSVIQRYAKKVYLVYDADEAGIKATKKATELALSKGFETMITTLPAGEDPDSMIQKNGTKAFRSYLNESLSFIDYFVKIYRRNGNLATPEGKTAVSREMLKLIAQIPDRLKHDMYVGHLAGILGLSESELRSVYQEKSNIERRFGQEHTYQKNRKQETQIIANNEQTKNSDSILKDLLPEENVLISIAINDKAGAEIIFDQLEINADKMITFAAKRIIEIISQYIHKNNSTLSMITQSNDIDEQYKQAIIDISMRMEQPSPLLEKYRKTPPSRDDLRAAKDSLMKLEMTTLSKERKKHVDSLKDPNQKDLHPQALQIISEIDLKINQIKQNLMH
ncbi:MAG: DNA primase [Candidatus Kapaibacterium sp.]